MRIGLLLLLTITLLARESMYSQLIKYDHPVTEEKPIVLVMRSYNNIKYYEKNLQSALNQNYANYRVIYIEDRSPDGTYDAVKGYLQRHDTKGLVTLIQNSQRLGAMANLFFASHMCRNDEIIVVLDGDDWFPHENVLKKVNQMYANPDVWMTYGQYLNVTPHGNKRGHCRLFFPRCRNVRGHPFVTSHLRTFYAGLFKRIRLQDLLYQGRFLHVCEDNAGSFPTLEMAHGHVYFNPQILYIHNSRNPLNDFRRYKNTQPGITRYLRRLAKYAPLKQHPASEEPIGSVDLIVRPSGEEQLRCFIEHLQDRSTGLEHIYILSGKSQRFASVKDQYPEIHWVTSSDVHKAVERSNAKYVCVSKDTLRFQTNCSFDEYAQLLTKTQAFAMHIGLDQAFKEEVQGIYITDQVSGWVYGENKTFWSTQPSDKMTIYRKEGLVAMKNSLGLKKNLMIGLYPNQPILRAEHL